MSMYLKKAKKIFYSVDYSCVICNDTDVYTSKLRGVKPLVKYLSDGFNFRGFSAADKVVGKATAFLYIKLGVKELYASVISRPALYRLEKERVSVEYDVLVDNIINRKGDGICPFEEAVLDIDGVDDAFMTITKLMVKLEML